MARSDSPDISGVGDTTGEFDEITLDCHKTIRDGIAGNARFAVMPGCSHMTMVEKPEEYNALVRRFLREA